LIIAFESQKGGVGKSTLALHLATALAAKGRVRVVDADPQGTCLAWASVRQREPLFEVGGYDRPNLHEQMPKMAEGFAHVIIDGPPRVTALAKSVIAASELVVIPIQPSQADIWAAAETVELIQEAQVMFPALRAVFVINRRISNSALARDVRAALEKAPFPCLTASIGQRVGFAEAIGQGETVLEREPRGMGAKEIAAFAAELMKVK
jgi:chromosome partitioning protein